LSTLFAAWGPLLLALSARIAVVLGARQLNDRPLRWASVPAAILLGEYVTWAAFLRALRTRTVTWRGNALRIGPGGQLERV
jgi:hypothetical protein